MSNVPSGYIESKYVLPIYEHIKVGDKDFVKIKYFIGYQVLGTKSKNRMGKSLEKALLNVKILTGDLAGTVEKGKYICVYYPYNEESMLIFGDEQKEDLVYMYERNGEYFLFDKKLRDDLWIHNYTQDGQIGSSSRVILPEYVTVSELNEIIKSYNESEQVLINKTMQDQKIKPDSIF